MNFEVGEDQRAARVQGRLGSPGRPEVHGHDVAGRREATDDAGDVEELPAGADGPEHQTGGFGPGRAAPGAEGPVRVPTDDAALESHSDVAGGPARNVPAVRERPVRA